MMIILKRALYYLLFSLIIAFVLIPAYEIFVGGLPMQDAWQNIRDNISFQSIEIWKRVFTFYLALWCGKAILWALSTASMKPQ